MRDMRTGLKRTAVFAAGVVVALGSFATSAIANPGGQQGQATHNPHSTASPSSPSTASSTSGSSSTSSSSSPSASSSSSSSPSAASSSSTGNSSNHNPSTNPSLNSPQPLSNADQNAGGANGQCPGGPYCSTRNGAPSGNGNGNGNAVGKPCAGCVGKADNKNPHGQMPNGSDHNAGYECDRNHGIGRTNPAHTGCRTASVVIPPNTPPPPPPCVPGPGQNNQCQTPQPPPCVPGPGQNAQCQLISVTVPPTQPGVTPVVLGEVLTRPGAALAAPAVIQPVGPAAQVLGSTTVATPAVLPRTGLELATLLVFAALALATGALALRYGSRRPEPLS